VAAELPRPGVVRINPEPFSHPIVAATTSRTAVVGTFPSGSLDEAVLVSSWHEFEAAFARDDPVAPSGAQPSLAVHAVAQFFANGGSGAWIVRVPDADAADALADALLTELAAGARTPRLDGIAPDRFDLMCIPEVAWLTLAAQHAVLAAAMRYCEQRGAMLIADPPAPAAASGSAPFGLDLEVHDVGRDPAALGELLSSWGGELLVAANIAGAAYYPWIEIPDAVSAEPRLVPPSGSVAGVYAQTDTASGVWEAPAGANAGLTNVTKLADETLTDATNSLLNASGINCLRALPQSGTVVWGARTMAGSDRDASEWKYVPVRRLATYIEHSIDQSTGWAVFERNDEGLWAQIRIAVGQFMSDLLREGAFQGATPDEAFFVKCDATTTSPEDLAAGLLNVLVGFAPLRPAEFVTLRIAVRAGLTGPP
jgi:hypothetical protein